SVYVDAENPRDLCPIFCIQKIMAAKHICRIRKKPGAHRVTLAGDRVGSRPGPPDIAGHQREIDDRLRRARGLVALIHTHCPPERDTPPPMDRLCKFSQLLCIQSGRLAHRICGELRDKVCECLKAETGGLDGRRAGLSVAIARKRKLCSRESGWDGRSYLTCVAGPRAPPCPESSSFRPLQPPIDSGPLGIPYVLRKRVAVLTGN